MPLNRRRFLSALGTSAAFLPLLTRPTAVSAAAQAGRTLVLIELAGGNDGLNTVVPFSDPAYRGLRPDIGIAQAAILSLDADTGLHPSLRAMADIWERGQLQIIEGVGYPQPNRSHFRSIEIWNAGLGADSTERKGWIANAFDQGQGPAPTDADGLVLGGAMGPLNGKGRFSAMRDENGFLETLDNLPQGQHAVRPAQVQSPLSHVLATYENAQATGAVISRKLAASRAKDWDFPQTDIAQQLRTAARLLDAGVDVPVLKVVQDGYDTHDAQPDRHSLLLADLSAAISAFSQTLQEAGLWQAVTIMTYSEFGRTARQNASAGTDHGTAAPVFVMGGAVRGGLAGQRVALDRLEDGDLVHTTDYRDVYGAVLRDLWGIGAGQTASQLRLLHT